MDSSRYHPIGRRELDQLAQIQILDPDHRLAMRAVAAVLPFRTNSFVINELIDWDAVPDDPMFRLTFPQPGMLSEAQLDRMVGLLRRDAPPAEVEGAAREIQRALNPHPAGQLDLNVPRDASGRRLEGMQHKYRETVVFFPAAGQTCHAYCSYCFRWPQFVGIPELKFAARDARRLVEYLTEHREVTSVLFTGGDPMVMSSKVLRTYVEPLLAPELSHITSIRIGSKSLTYWPFRFTSQPDAEDVLRLYEEVVASGRSLAFMAHFCHPRELEPTDVRAALARVRGTGAEVYAQAPIVRHVNDDADSWVELLDAEVRMGINPYYMFVERDTGARAYFELELVRAHEIFRSAYRRVTGLARTLRGPTMSCLPGKVKIDDVLELDGEKVFSLQFLQARDPEWVGRTFFAEYDAGATWFDQLRPARGERWFFQSQLESMIQRDRLQPWLERPVKRR
jgi:L-lysine 2,3-aminomutase